MPCLPITLKVLKPKETDFDARTLGDHVRKRRLELRLSQKEVADQFGVNPWTVLNWEKSHTEPPIESIPAILRCHPLAAILGAPGKVLVRERD